MNLSDEQKQTIALRLADGASIADIQRLVTDEFNVAATYMETRFLIDDLNLDLKEEPKPEPDEIVDADGPPLENESQAPAPESAEASLVDDGPIASASVTVEIDPVKAPGTALNGTVVFSDGVSAKWYIDQMGRLGLDSEQEGYQPSHEDIEAFQVELQAKMQSQGF